MKKLTKKKITGWVVTTLFVISLLSGCRSESDSEGINEEISSENIIITETGEVLEKEEKEPDADAAASPQVVTIDAELLVEPEQEQIITEDEQMETQENNLQLVFLGDSIFDNYRDGTGVPYRTAVQCGADVYNLAIGGTCAAVAGDEQTGLGEWTSRSLVGMVNAISGKIPTDVFANDYAKKILDSPDIDFSKTDYFIVEYGMNDFLCAVPLTSQEEFYDIKTYVGALRYAVNNLKDVAPDATIILCAPTYAQFYNGDWMIGDGNSVNNGYGTLFDYKGICEYVADEQQTLFFNAYQDIGINGYTAEEYLEDGIHLTDAGRQLYADGLAKKILKYEETKNN